MKKVPPVSFIEANLKKDLKEFMLNHEMMEIMMMVMTVAADTAVAMMIVGGG